MTATETASPTAQWVSAIQNTLNLNATIENVKEAVRVLVRLWDDDIPPPSVVPRSNGNIQLEWHTLKYNVEIYIEQPDETVVWMENRDTDAVLYDGPLKMLEAPVRHLLANE